MIYLVFVAAVLTRFLSNSHLPELSPVFGALLFCGARLKQRDALWFPLTVLALAEWVLTTQVFHMQVRWGQSITLLGFAAMAWIGGLLRKRLTVSRFVGCATGGSAAYFLISNFGVWLSWGTYPHTRDGLVACYVAALPYYRSSMLSTLIFGAVLFWGYECMRRRHQGGQFQPSAAQVIR